VQLVAEVTEPNQSVKTDFVAGGLRDHFEVQHTARHPADFGAIGVANLVF
jgi:hypothetical protein